MKLNFVILHQDCAAIAEGQTEFAPKFAITDFSEDGSKIRLTCSFCAQLLTLTCHTPDNPPEELHAPERTHQLHPAG